MEPLAASQTNLSCSNHSLRFAELLYSVSVVRSDDPHLLLLSVSVAVEVLHVVNTTTVSRDDPPSSLEAAAVLGAHDFCLGGGCGEKNAECDRNDLYCHWYFLLAVPGHVAGGKRPWPVDGGLDGQGL